MNEDLRDVVVDLGGDPSRGLVGQQQNLDAQEGDEDQGGPHRLHVQSELSLVGHLQLGDENPHDVEQEEEVHLEMTTLLV